jgi:hypothetical protein
MKRPLSGLVLLAQFCGATLDVASAAEAPVPDSVPASEKQFRIAHQEADPRFITSIERVGPCKVTTPPETGIRVPWQLYPKASVDKHEDGTVIMELKLDPIRSPRCFGG